MWRCKESVPVPAEVRRVADLLERRYAVSILFASHQGCTRFTEFRQALGSDGICLEAHCVSYGTAIPYLPLLDMVRSACGLQDGDAPETLAAALEARLESVPLRAGSSS